MGGHAAGELRGAVDQPARVEQGGREWGRREGRVRRVVHVGEVNEVDKVEEDVEFI